MRSVRSWSVTYIPRVPAALHVQCVVRARDHIFALTLRVALPSTMIEQHSRTVGGDRTTSRAIRFPCTKMNNINVRPQRAYPRLLRRCRRRRVYACLALLFCLGIHTKQKHTHVLRISRALRRPEAHSIRYTRCTTTREHIWKQRARAVDVRRIAEVKKQAGEHTLYIYSICMYTCMDECARVFQTLSVRPGAREARMRART